LGDLKQMFMEQFRVYEQEKKLYHLMSISLRLGGKFWWEFWQDLIPNFSMRQQLRLWSEIWKNRFSKLSLEYDYLINQYLQSQSEEYKQAILERLKEDYETQPRIWIDFVLSTKYEQVLIDNLSKFDAGLLLDICEILPEQREKIEIQVLNQIKLWSDFTVVGDYSELEKVLKKWAILGRSDYFQDALSYIRDNHRKKTKLMSIVKSVE
jgi:hypothetical protein